MLQGSRTAADLSIARYLFPRLVAFVTDVESEDPERARWLVIHTLCLYVASVEPSRMLAAMSMVIPVLMAHATGEGTKAYKETSIRLLEVAAIDQGAFRAVVGGLSGGQRAFLEEVIRSGQDAANVSDKTTADGSGQPTITLKMNFGS